MSSQFIQLIVDGLASGSIYAALALAIVLVNQATGLINFAQGAMAVFSTYIAYSLWQAGMWPLAAILITLALSLLFGAGVERVIIRRFERGSIDAAVVVTVGLFVLIAGIAGAIWSYNPLPFPSLFPLTTITIGGAVIGIRSLGTLAVLIVVMVLLQLLFQRTKLGLALRAVADNPVSSSLSGLPVGRLLMVGWALAAALGALAGTLVAPQVFLSPGMLDFILVYALAAAILGGLDSPVGAVVAALFIGVAENLAGAYIPFIGDDLKIAVPLAAMFVILIVRPQGLFGRREVVRV
jgi:Branched-chain amino acid ABC-type transport system, permease components